jgi:predicted  nucleic acid-binding Zn-ribbon protein
MAEPTLKDVLKAIAELQKGQTEIRSGFARLEAKMDAGFERVERQLSEIDADLERHMTVHAKLEREVDTLKRRPRSPPTTRPTRRRAR